MNIITHNILVQERITTPKGFTVILDDDILAYKIKEKYMYYMIHNQFAFINKGLFIGEGCINNTPAGTILYLLKKTKLNTIYKPCVLIYDDISIRYIGKKFQIKSKNNKLYLHPC